MAVAVRSGEHVAKVNEYLKWKYVIGEREDCIERLAPDMLDRFVKNQLTLVELKQIAFLYQFVTGVTLLKGKGGSGKTLTMTQILYNLHRYFGMPVITDYELKQSFGEFVYMSTDEFIEELKNVDDLIKGRKSRISELSNKEINERMAEAAEEMLKHRGISFDNAAIGWDEANRKLDTTRATSRMVMMHRYFVQTWRHYQCSLILATPEREGIISAALGQVTIELGCSYDKQLKECTAIGVNRQAVTPMVMRTFMPNYSSLYDTHQPISIRDAVMGFKGLKL